MSLNTTAIICNSILAEFLRNNPNTIFGLTIITNPVKQVSAPNTIIIKFIH